MDTTATLKKQKGIENFFHTMFLIFGLFSIAFVLFITIFLVISGVPAITKIGFFKFIFGTKWASTASNPSFGILPFILTSVYGTCGALLVSVPVGIFCAAYLAKMAPGPVAAVVREAVDLLAGIPSVVYGLFGMIIIVPGVRKLFNLPDGANLFSATVVLAIMVLPSIISESETALRAVPKEYEEGSLALGATYTETIFKVTLPAARSGVLTSVILGTGRAIGEAMAVMMVAGNVANMPGIFRSVRFLTTA
ncbi:MAG: phosphate ABC transporter permease subunit PstC, partial [Lachnospiraceae bacterium]|nr:phosphate ABC transporter permease subunit PstC [Lachnospiraceae bacterium]